ncbi:MAG: HNH endonuclease [Bdellovibrionales bacterium]
MFEFPENAEFRTVEPVLKRAVYEAFGGKDYYTGESISIREMTIDHVVPKSKGGPNNIFNYVPTVESVNQEKGASFVWARERKTLSEIRDVYGPKVMELLKEQGVLDLRRGTLEALMIRGQEVKKPGYHILFTGLTRDAREFIDHVFNEFFQKGEAEKSEIQRTGVIRVSLLKFDEREVEHALSEFRYNLDYVSREFKERLEAEGEVVELHTEGFSFSARAKVDVKIHPELIRKLMETDAVSLSVESIFDSAAISRADFESWTVFY